MTVKLSRSLIASIALCTMVGAALAQQSSSNDLFGSRSRTDAAPATAQDPSANGLLRSTTPAFVQTTPAVQTFTGWIGRDSYHSAGASAGQPPGEELKLAQMVQQLAGRISGTMSAPDRDRIKVELRDLLEKQFELRQGRHEKEIEALEAQVRASRTSSASGTTTVA